MNWTKITPYHDEYALWISGIYEVLTYDGKHFHAYYIRDGDKNWGWNVAQPPLTGDGYHHLRCWPSLEVAQHQCESHAVSYTPKPYTIKRAGEVMESLIAEQEANRLWWLDRPGDKTDTNFNR